MPTLSSKMGKINSEILINLIKDVFPDYLPYWESFVKDWGESEGLSIKMIPFNEYAIQIIKINDLQEMQKIADFAEFLIRHGDEKIQSAMTTVLLEDLMSHDKHEIKFSNFAKHLGSKSLEYCREWDKFTGLRTDGLWSDDEDPC